MSASSFSLALSNPAAGGDNGVYRGGVSTRYERDGIKCIVMGRLNDDVRNPDIWASLEVYERGQQLWSSKKAMMSMNRGAYLLPRLRRPLSDLSRHLCTGPPPPFNTCHS